MPVSAPLEILPSIDLRGGRVVDLFQGDYAKETVYAETPEAVAERFVGGGARWIHCVDLDGAREGAPANRAAVERIAAVASPAGARLQLGGGIRSLAAARAALAAGAKNVLILDMDAHCGGGTSELLGSHPNVWIVDVAVHGFDRYAPIGHNTLDVIGVARQYLPTVRARLEALPNRAPAFDLCLYNAGMDPHQGCPIGGLAGIDGAILQARETLVFEWCRRQGIPIAFALAGGYLGPYLSQRGLTDLHRLTLAAAAQHARL